MVVRRARERAEAEAQPGHQFCSIGRTGGHSDGGGSLELSRIGEGPGAEE